MIENKKNNLICNLIAIFEIFNIDKTHNAVNSFSPRIIKTIYQYYHLN